MKTFFIKHYIVIIPIIILLVHVIPKIALSKTERVNYRLREKELLDGVLGRGYDKRIRPSGNNKTDGPAIVIVNLYLRTISRIDDVKMEYSVQVTFREQWNDERLRFFDNTHGHLKYLTLTDPTKIWMPDTFFRNEKDAKKHEIIVPNVYVRIFPDGEVLYSIRISLTLSCPMNLRLYPLDKQVCVLQIASYGWAKDDLIYVWKTNDPVQLMNELHLPRFTLESYRSAYCDVITNTGEYSCLKVELVFRREFSYYLLTIYMPCCMLVIVSWVSFWLDQNAIPARVSLGVTTLLTMSTQTSGINAQLPPVSYTKSVDVWTGVCQLFVFCALLEFALVNYASRSDVLRYRAQSRARRMRMQQERMLKMAEDRTAPPSSNSNSIDNDQQQASSPPSGDKLSGVSGAGFIFRHPDSPPRNSHLSTATSPCNRITSSSNSTTVHIRKSPSKTSNINIGPNQQFRKNGSVSHQLTHDTTVDCSTSKQQNNNNNVKNKPQQLTMNGVSARNLKSSDGSNLYRGSSAEHIEPFNMDANGSTVSISGNNMNNTGSNAAVAMNNRIMILKEKKKNKDPSVTGSTMRLRMNSGRGGHQSSSDIPLQQQHCRNRPNVRIQESGNNREESSRGGSRISWGAESSSRNLSNPMIHDPFLLSESRKRRASIFHPHNLDGEGLLTPTHDPNYFNFDDDLDDDEIDDETRAYPYFITSGGGLAEALAAEKAAEESHKLSMRKGSQFDCIDTEDWTGSGGDENTFGSKSAVHDILFEEDERKRAKFSKLRLQSMSGFNLAIQVGIYVLCCGAKGLLSKVPSRAKRIDVISRVIFPLIFAIFNLVYWLYFLLASNVDITS